MPSRPKPARAVVPADDASQTDMEPTDAPPIETTLSKRWKAYYLSLGLGRSLVKVAQEIADLRLMEREGYRLDPRQGPKRNAHIRQAIVKLRETDPLWQRQYLSARNRVSIWSFRFGWVAAAGAFDAQMLADTQREWQAKELEMRSRHYETGMALELQGANDYLKASQAGKVSAPAAIQAVGMGAQLERSALSLSGGKGLQVASLSSLMSDLARPAEAGQPGAYDGAQNTDVSITQINTTNNTLVVQPPQPLTVDMLRQLEARATESLTAYRSTRSLPPPTEKAWYATVPPPPPPLPKRQTTVVVEGTLAGEIVDANKEA